MNKVVKNKIYATISQLHEELDKCYELRKTLNFDTQFGALITTTTRTIILKEFIQLFKLVKKGDISPKPPLFGYTFSKGLLERMSVLTKRVKLHFSQLKRLQDNVADNMIFFTTLTRVLFNLIINKKLK